MSGHKPWSEIKHKKDEPALKRLGRGLAEFFNPRDWISTFPIPRKPYPKAQGYQSLYEALRGFKDDGKDR